jgi:hypothetical protein
MILGTTERKSRNSLHRLIQCAQESTHEAIILLLRVECCCLGNIVECERPEIDL